MTNNIRWEPNTIERLSPQIAVPDGEVMALMTNGAFVRTEGGTRLRIGRVISK